MTLSPRDRQASLAALVVDPTLVASVKPDSVAVLWSADGSNVLWASPGGEALAAHLPSAARQRIALLARGLAPADAVRLERLRFGAGLRAERVTCACRRIELAAGGMALLTVATGPLPPQFAAELSALPDPAPDMEVVSIASAHDQIAATRALAERRPTIRFVWETDAQDVFTRISPDLAAAMGEASAAIVGRAWRDLSDVIGDADFDVTAAFAVRQTWSGRTVLWRIGSTRAAVPVELAGAPILDANRRFAGFRGFGLARLNALVADAWPEEASIDGPPTGSDMRPRLDRAPDLAEPTTEPSVASSEPGPDHVVASGLHDEPDLSTGAAEPDKPARSLAPLIPFPTMRSAVPARFDLGRPAPLRLVESPDDGRPSAKPRDGLSSTERNAFREIARALGARFAGDEPEPGADRSAPDTRRETLPTDANEPAPGAPKAVVGATHAALLERLPIGIVVNRGETPVYANRSFLDLIGHASLASLTEAGLATVFGAAPGSGPVGTDAPLQLMTPAGDIVPAEVQLVAVEWDGEPATLMTFRRIAEAAGVRHLRALELELHAREARESELISILDTATDGVIVIDERGRMLSLNRSAEALFGYDQNEVAGELFTLLFAPESHALAFDYLAGLKSSGVASLLNDGREVTGRVRQGGRLPLFVTIGRVGEGPERKFCAVLRDLTAWKKAESELLESKRSAERANAQKSDFLAKISHEIRTPLNAVIGFAEVMLEERFGPIGTERYKEYLRDIHASGGHVISLVNDLLDLAKIEAGRLELTFTSVKLNDIVVNCVALLQPQANRERIVLRTSLAPRLPPVVADERSMRQVVLNVLSNAVKFTEAGGQVIVSTTLSERGEVALRVRDTGIGMSDKEIEAALEPFRQLATSRRTGGTGLGLPLTKALIEANRGSLLITSAKHEGTLVEVIMPRTRVLAE